MSWTVDQKRAVVGGVRDILGADTSARSLDAIALVEELLGPGDEAEPRDYAKFRTDPHAEVALVALIVAACIKSGGPGPAEVARVAAYAKAMDADPVWVRALGHAAKGRGHRVTMTLAPRAPDGRRVLQAAWRARGPLVVFDVLRSLSGNTRPDPELAAWFRQLEHLPEGTVGRSFWTNLSQRGIAYPGESGGLPEAALHHDLVHTLTGYDTEPAGECEIGGFYAGMLYPGWPAWIIAGLTTFELGLRVGPSFTEPTKGAFDLRRVWAAAKRGHEARFRPLDDWDYRSLMALPLDEARDQLGI